MRKSLLAILFLMASFSELKFAAAKEFPPRWVELELEEAEGASAYELEFTSVRTGKTAKFRTETVQWRAKVRPGKYNMRLRSYDSRGVPGEWSDAAPITINFPGPKLLTPAMQEKVATKENDEAKVKFTWENIEGLPYYKLEVKSGDKVWTEVLEKSEYTLELPVGQAYEWTVFALQAKDEAGEPSDEPGKFVLEGKKLAKPEIRTPMDKYISEISWDPVKYAKSYTYIVSRYEGGKWKPVHKKAQDTDAKIVFPPTLGGGQMRLQVRAEAEGRPTSDIAAIDFPLFEGSRDPASVDTHRLRDSIEKPTNWYAIASYYVAPMKYQGVDVLASGRNKVSLSPIGGTGRLGTGYFTPKSQWGFIGVADLSGFTLEGGKTKTYPSVELHGAWRKYYGVNQLRLSGGLYQRNFVEVYQPVPSVEDFKFRDYDVMGLHGGLDYWHPINFKYGIQFNTRLYLPASADTPGKHEFTPSYSMGFMGTYRLAPKVMGFAGYAYRVDTLRFRGENADAYSTNFSGRDPNQDIKYTGHYVNLLLEWGF